MTIFKSSGILQFLTLALTVLLISCTSVKQTDKVNVEITDFNMPVLLRKDHNKVAKLTVQLNDSTASKTLVGIELEVAGDLPLTAIKNISVLSDTAATVDFKKAK